MKNNDEGGKGEDQEFDSFFDLHDYDTDVDQEGGSGAASNNDTNMASADEERRGSFADNNDGNNSTITKMDNNNSSNSEGSTNQKEELSPEILKLWYDRISVVQQRQVEMNVNAVLYSGCMAEAPQLFGTMEH